MVLKVVVIEGFHCIISGRHLRFGIITSFVWPDFRHFTESMLPLYYVGVSNKLHQCESLSLLSIILSHIQVSSWAITLYSGGGGGGEYIDEEVFGLLRCLFWNLYRNLRPCSRISAENGDPEGRHVPDLYDTEVPALYSPSSAHFHVVSYMPIPGTSVFTFLHLRP